MLIRQIVDHILIFIIGLDFMSIESRTQYLLVSLLCILLIPAGIQLLTNFLGFRFLVKFILRMTSSVLILVTLLSRPPNDAQIWLKFKTRAAVVLNFLLIPIKSLATSDSIKCVKDTLILLIMLTSFV